MKNQPPSLRCGLSSEFFGHLFVVIIDGLIGMTGCLVLRVHFQLIQLGVTLCDGTTPPVCRYSAAKCCLICRRR